VLLRADAARNFTATQIKPGKFQPFGHNGTLLAERVAKNGELQGLFVETENAGKTVVVLAARGRIHAVPEANEFLLTLYDGKYYEGVTGERRFRIVNFREYNRSIPLPEGTTVCTRPDARKTLDLFATPGPHEIAELNFRFGQLALALIFMLLAVPLSTTRPREGAYSRVPAALGVFALGNFGLLGVASWSARAPLLGSTVLWACLALGFIIAIRWLATFGRVKSPA
jgi:lipopolysaccharide export system permease protein